MSQEINLLNPALRPRRDWLSFGSVSLAGLTALLVVGVGAAVVRAHLSTGMQAQQEAARQLSVVREEVQALQSALAGRRADPLLAQEAARLAATVARRREVLRLARDLAAEPGEVADVMRGLSRQRTEGVWLTGFNVGPEGFDLSGRLLDPGLLPTYIRKLNAEPAFRGRHFAALDMLGVEPPPPVSATPPPQPQPTTGQTAGAPVRYVEFSLKATAASVKSPGGSE